MTSPAQVTVDMEIPGATSLGFAGLEWQAAVSSPFVGTLEVTSTSPSLNLAGLLGAPVRVVVTGAQRRRQTFAGEVDGVEQCETRSGRTTYRLTVRPALWRLALRRRSRVFTEATAVEILGRLLDDHGIGPAVVRAEGEGGTLAQVVQYDETDLSLVERLLGEAGLHYRFQHSTGGDVVVVDAAANEPRRRLGYVGGVVGAAGVTAWTVRASRGASAPISARGELNVPGIEVGEAFVLVGHPRADQNGAQVALSATYRVDCDRSVRPGRTGVPASFAAEVVARPHGAPLAEQPSPGGWAPRRTPTVQPAVVTGPPGERVHVDELGRVRVRPGWEPSDGASLLAPVAQPSAGDGRGTTFWPGVGDRVLIEFEDGDPSRPVVIGSTYDGTRRPPIEVPAGGEETALVSDSARIVLDDRAGQQQLSISTAGDQLSAVGGTHSTSVLGDDLTSVGRRLTSIVGTDRLSETGGDAVTTVSGDLTVSVSGNRWVTVRGDSTEAVDGRATVAVAGDRLGTVRGDDELTVDGDLVIEAGRRLVLRCGDASITLSPNGDIDIEGGDVALDASDELVLKGSKIVD